MGRRKKVIRNSQHYKDNYLRRRGVESFDQCLLQGEYYAKYDQNGEFRYVGYSTKGSSKRGIPVSVSISKEQHIPIGEDSDFWGFLRYRSGFVVSAYRGYINSREKWSDPERLESDGIGCFLRLNVSRKT